MLFRKAYDAYDEKKRFRVSISFLDENGDPMVGETEQCHKDSCDINNILKQYDKTGLITHVNKSVGEYGDFTEVNEYQESMNTVIKAQDAFDELPSKVKQEFGFDPGTFFEFASNPANHDKMVELGLANPKEVVEPIKVEVTNVAENVPFDGSGA